MCYLSFDTKKIVIAIEWPFEIPDDAIKMLKPYGKVAYAPSLLERDLIEVFRDADATILGAFQFKTSVIETAEKLKIIARFGIGVDNVDLKAATDKGVIVTNVPKIMAESVAEHTLALMLAAAKNLVVSDRCVRSDRWRKFWELGLGTELWGKTLGIVGLGSIGSKVAEKSKAAFNMKILVYDPYVKPEKVKEISGEMAGLDRLLKESDVVSLHVPLTSETRHMVGEEQLRMMKKSAILINTARGQVVDQKALLKALTEKTISMVALDVLEKEPPIPDDPLLDLDNVIFTGHIGSVTNEAFHRVWIACTKAIIDVFEGRLPQPPANIVNREVIA